jgi:hypothetical protein
MELLKMTYKTFILEDEPTLITIRKEQLEELKEEVRIRLLRIEHLEAEIKELEENINIIYT